MKVREYREYTYTKIRVFEVTDDADIEWGDINEGQDGVKLVSTDSNIDVDCLSRQIYQVNEADEDVGDPLYEWD